MKCKLCDRNVSILTELHLIPKQKGGKKSETISICEACHKMIHEFYTNSELAIFYYTKKLLTESEKVGKFINWIRTRPDEYLTVARKKKR